MPKYTYDRGICSTHSHDASVDYERYFLKIQHKSEQIEQRTHSQRQPIIDVTNLGDGQPEFKLRISFIPVVPNIDDKPQLDIQMPPLLELNLENRAYVCLHSFSVHLGYRTFQQRNFIQTVNWSSLPTICFDDESLGA